MLNRYLTVSLASGFLFLFVALTMTEGRPQKKKYPDPTPRKEQILKLFVEEFINVTPGKGKFSGSFLMGSRKDLANAQPVHQVTFDYRFAVAKYEVTQELYHVVMGKNPSRWKGLRNSVERITWQDAKSFCRKATRELRQRKLIGAGEAIRLPSEAEWEYVCRAGATTPFSFGKDVTKLTLYAWYRDNSKGHDPPVGAKKPNNWGFYDMHGYIWEWCADDWQAGYRDAPNDGSPRKVKGAKEKTMRGGSWAAPAQQCRCAYRGHVSTDTANDKIGFRCVLAGAMKKGGTNAGQ